MSLSLRKLEIFVSIAHFGSITHSAEKLRLSQSAVSMALADLEKGYNNPLFHRQGRKLQLNDQGRLLLPRAREILQQVAELERQLIDAAGEPTGRLHIGASTTIGNYLLPLLVARFSQSYPKAEVFMRVGNSEFVTEALKRGELDLGLVEGLCQPLNLPSYPWRDDELIVIAGRDHPWTLSGKAHFRDLQEANWIVREEGSGTREVFEQALGQPLSQLSTVIEMGHTEAIKKAVEANLGVSCLSRLAVERELQAGYLTEIITPLKLSRPLSLILAGKQPHSRLLLACLEMLLPGFNQHGAS